ncbi:MAG: zinc carboxypeptidase [Ferruginibacter sp.]|nr:zinc carboxypeptidase [Ferruginibacter sp.]
MKRLFLLVSILFSITSFAQLKSPEAFLGYKIGSRYTPHHRVINYFEYVAQAAPNDVKLEQYGETNEHRPLYTAFISGTYNIANLENIRLNNLRLAHLAKDKIIPTENGPAIVWLSYNVHGNETSSSEAAMLTLFALVDPANIQAKEWLKNTIVVIDPCLNPDGRERYINWFNSVVGGVYNPENISREHQEPWPGGRTNHYNFDLNRDWCWQTQVESRQRVMQYNKWMPQVHVDFHEQGVNDPYYFAPAAQPYHEVITKWQRDFQVAIGKNNAKYFDSNNWLYFTREIFDLLYPSYGDTYPLYNGSIGMTYEQAGGPAGGLGANTNDGDTLTLYDRAFHHFTSSMSTIETASLQATALVKEFHTFFGDAVAGKVGGYKSYIIKNNPGDAERIAALKQLLDNNNIQYGNSTGSGKGFQYQSKKEEAFTILGSDLVISNAQPKAALIKVLFEPETKLVDSVTYDITAWAIPYAYGLTAYASKQLINPVAAKTLPDSVKNDGGDAYGYVIRWQGVSSVRTVAALMEKNIRMRFSETPFETGGQSFERGSVIILKKGNQRFSAGLWQTVADICNRNNIKMNKVNSGLVEKGFDFGSSYVHLLNAPKVAMLTGEDVNSNAAGEIWHFFDKEINYKLTLINAGDFNRIDLNKIDVLILPDGRYKFLNSKENAEKFHLWIENGGRVVAFENAVAQLSKQEWSNIHSRNMADSNSFLNKDSYELLQGFDIRERVALSNNTSGSIFKVDTDNTHPLMFGYPKYYYSLKMDNAVYDFMKDGGWNTGVIKKENQVAGYVGYKLNPKLKDGLLFGVQELGNGSVIYLTDNVMFRDFWENGKLMFCNAVFLVGQ